MAMGEEQGKKSWLWPIIIVALIIISIIQVTAFDINKSSNGQRIFWIFSLVVWSIAGMAMIVKKIIQSREKNN